MEKTSNKGPFVKISRVVIGGQEASVLAIGPKVRGFKTGQRRWIFKGDKIPQHAFFGVEVKLVGPM
jgi:hypothetical protein